MSTSGQRAKVNPARPPSLGGEFRGQTKQKSRPRPYATPTRLERLPRRRLPRASAAQGSPVAPHTATLVRFDFYGDESGNEAVATKKGSYEIQGDAVEMQIGDPNAVYSAPQVDITI
jgi:hypothetical protein